MVDYVLIILTGMVGGMGYAIGTPIGNRLYQKWFKQLIDGEKMQKKRQITCPKCNTHHGFLIEEVGEVGEGKYIYRCRNCNEEYKP